MTIYPSVSPILLETSPTPSMVSVILRNVSGVVSATRAGNARGGGVGGESSRSVGRLPGTVGDSPDAFEGLAHSSKIDGGLI